MYDLADRIIQRIKYPDPIISSHIPVSVKSCQDLCNIKVEFFLFFFVFRWYKFRDQLFLFINDPKTELTTDPDPSTLILNNICYGKRRRGMISFKMIG